MTLPATSPVLERPKRSTAGKSPTSPAPRERSWSTALFAVCARPVPEDDEASPIEGYLVVHPESGELCSNRSFPDGYCRLPLLMDKAQAQALAQRLAAPGGHRWEAVAAPAPCAHCGRVIWADDRDFCYPLNRERTQWRAGCNEHDFGCGHEVFGDSKEAAMQAWSERGERKPPEPAEPVDADEATDVAAPDQSAEKPVTRTPLMPLAKPAAPGKPDET